MKWTSPMGRKVLGVLVPYLFGVLTAAGVFEARAWKYWMGEADQTVTEREAFFTQWALGIQRNAAKVAVMRHDAEPQKAQVVSAKADPRVFPSPAQVLDLQAGVNVKR